MCHQQASGPREGWGSDVVTESVTLSNGEDRIPCFKARPGRPGPHPGIVVIHDMWGANAFYQDLCRRLAAEGYAAILTDLFSRQGALERQDREHAQERRLRMNEPVALTDLEVSANHLAEEDSAGQKIGAIGFCMGGTLVLLWAARSRTLGAGVCYYGFPVRKTTENAPVNAIDVAGQVQAPIIGFWGDRDRSVGIENVEALHEKIESEGIEHEIHIYEGPPHGFLTFDEEDEWYEVSVDSWNHALDWFRRHLTGST
jgi:carboxymethylenebutenolidase